MINCIDDGKEVMSNCMKHNYQMPHIGKAEIKTTLRRAERKNTVRLKHGKVRLLRVVNVRVRVIFEALQPPKVIP